MLQPRSVKTHLAKLAILLCFLLSLSVMVLGIASRWRVISVNHSARGPTAAGGMVYRGTRIGFLGGSLNLRRGSLTVAPSKAVNMKEPDGFRLYTAPPPPRERFMNRLGFAWRTGNSSFAGLTDVWREICVPAWLLAILFAVPAIVWARRRYRARRAMHNPATMKPLCGQA